MDADLGPVPFKLREPMDKFIVESGCPEATLGDYWRWSSSSVLDNTERGVVAEFLVANALGLTDKPRVEWGAYDLKMPCGTKIEIKSSAYLQSWRQKDYSTIKFGIAQTKEAWDANTGESQAHDPPKRIADIYVFCLLKHKEKATVDPLNTEQWEFFVVPTFRINEEHSCRKEISLKQLECVVDHPTSYSDLADTVTSVAESISS
ncbi:MAG: hypothetical protein OXH11_17960 [Candidatus Aminicenantes bacterium]|nr:hypothetical protein [Candidatus Aminicenantes bacterium]